jgi:nicotinate-nucleotide pyrophosphorylase (carboxylating)
MNVASMPAESVADAVRRALEEDGAWDDATSRAVVPAAARASGRIEAREAGVLAGTAHAEAAFRLCDPEVAVEWAARDGARLQPGSVVARVEGRARGLLAAERTAMNYLQQLSGVATGAAAAAAAAGGLTVLDTRKTVPGMRAAQKAAVAAGGAANHRHGLSDQLLLKENHFALSGLEFGATVARAVAESRGRPVGAEAQTLDEAFAALEAGADYVLLDNFAPDRLDDAVRALRARYPHAVLEASGGIGVADLPRLAAAGVDRVSLGALTHSAPALDLTFLLDAPAHGGTA